MNGSTHFNFDQIIPADLGLDPVLNPFSVEKRRPTVYMRFGAIALTFTDAAETQRIAGAFTEAARLLREAEAIIASDEDGAS